MKVIKTALFLVITLCAVLLCTYFFGVSLGDEEWRILHIIFMSCSGVVLCCFFVGELSKNYSQTDKLWSLTPIVYVGIIGYYNDFSFRLLMMWVLVFIWGLRLTFNFSRHGGYSLRFWSGKEDYRWAILRKKPEFKGRWKWTLFNLFFISGYQNVLLVLISLPALVAFQFSNTTTNMLDFVASFLMLFFIVLETIADNQHWKFQSKKWEMIKAGIQLEEPYKKGFYDQILWSYMRHPNYFAEQGIWISFYLFSVAASGQWINWSIIGALLLVVLFKSSSDFSEEISAGKYPKYKDYQRRVPRFVPFFKIKTIAGSIPNEEEA